MLLIHMNWTVFNNFRTLELELASGLEDSLENCLKSGHVLQYPSAFKIHTQNMYQQSVELESSIEMHTQIQIIQIRL